MSNIIRCKFAGDAEDEFCAKCDGIIVADTENVPATECGGYEAEEPEPVVNEKVSSPQETDLDIQTTTEYIPKGKTQNIRAESGISKEIKGVWYKFNYSEERVLPEDCNLELEIQALWEHCNTIVDNQVQEAQNL